MAKKAAATKPQTQTLEMPAGVKCNGRPLPHVRIEWYPTDEEKRAFEGLRLSLIESGARLDNGRPVDQRPSVLRWIFQQLAAQEKSTAAEE